MPVGCVLRRIMKYLILVATFCLAATLPGFCRVGMGETYFQTPGGHIICDCDPYSRTPVLVGQENKIYNIDKFYFFKNHIIGYGPGYYFIFNEATGQTSLFHAQSQWQHSIKARDLKPVLYTNWLSIADAPENFLVMGFFLGLMASPILLPVLVITVVQLLRRKIRVSGRLLLHVGSAMLLLVLLAGSLVNIYSW